jgi:hypothetical protein
MPTIVKSEPRESVSTTAMATSGRNSGVVPSSEAEYDDAAGESHHVGGGELALEDSYQDESYDYGGGGGDYGDVSFGGEDGTSGGVIDPNTGLPLGAGASDGNKGRVLFLFFVVI